MRRFAFLLLCLATFVSAGCANPLKRGDEAYSRRDWDQATEHYEVALRSGIDPARRDQVQSRLDESRAKAGDAHAARSAQLEAIGNLPSACHEANLAYRFDPSDASAARLGALRAKWAEQLLSSGRASLEAGNLDAAVEQLSRAQALSPTADGQGLLAQAQAAAAEARRRAYDGFINEAERSMAAHDWIGATSHYASAHRMGHTEDSLRREVFSKAMWEAEAAIASRNEPVARRAFETALRAGIDSEYVRGRMTYLLPCNYVVTVMEGVVLPFKPETERPWDGVGVRQVAEAGEMLRSLAFLTGGESTMVTRVGEIVVGGLQSEIEPPDTYVLMTVDGVTLGSRDLARLDTYRPAWNTSFSIRGSPNDGDSLTITVMDRDLEEDDRVGGFPITAAELLSKPGVREFYFVTKEKELRAGGLLAIRISVERREEP